MGYAGPLFPLERENRAQSCRKCRHRKGSPADAFEIKYGYRKQSEEEREQTMKNASEEIL